MAVVDLRLLDHGEDMVSRQVGSRSIDPLSAPTPRGARDASRAPVARIALVSTYPPRRCGIATFTADLGRAIGDHEIVALDGPGDSSATDHPVHHVIRTDVRVRLRPSRSLTRRLRRQRGLRPARVRHLGCQRRRGRPRLPGRALRAGRGHAAHRAAPSDRRAAPRHARHPGCDCGGGRDVEGRSHDPGRPLRAPIRAGWRSSPMACPICPSSNPTASRRASAWAAVNLLLSFGLVGPSKGYESVIETMPDVVRAVPNACYVILGATHPELQRTEGERYRNQARDAGCRPGHDRARGLRRSLRGSTRAEPVARSGGRLRDALSEPRPDRLRHALLRHGGRQGVGLHPLPVRFRDPR